MRAVNYWSKSDEDLLLDYVSRGHTLREASIFLGRSLLSVSIKWKRLNKRINSFLSDKYLSNLRFLDILNQDVNIRSVLDVYAGESSFWLDNCSNDYDLSVVYNDKYLGDGYRLDALDLLCTMYLERRNFDIIDLDPFGSAFDCFDFAIKLARYGLIITFGELGHLRFRRLDFVRRYYRIDNIVDFNVYNMIKVVREIGLRNKKDLVPLITLNKGTIARVYFAINRIKIVEQWDNDQLDLGLV